MGKKSRKKRAKKSTVNLSTGGSLDLSKILYESASTPEFRFEPQPADGFMLSAYFDAIQRTMLARRSVVDLFARQDDSAQPALPGLPETRWPTPEMRVEPTDEERIERATDRLRSATSLDVDWSKEEEATQEFLNALTGETEDEEDGTMASNAADLEEAVVGHCIVSVEAGHRIPSGYSWGGTREVTVITLDNGKRVALEDTNDCCAYTDLQAFFLNPDRVDHIITGVATTDGYTTWHIYADLGDVLQLSVGWSAGNPYYYGYGFNITVLDIDEDSEA